MRTERTCTLFMMPSLETSTKALGSTTPAAPLANLPRAKRKMYEDLFALIYQCSVNQVAAKSLIDRILLKIS